MIFSVEDFASRDISYNGEICGGVVSCIVTVCDAIAMFPAPSIAVQIIVLIPNGKDDGALWDNDNIPFSSVAIASPIFTEVREPDASIIISSGTKIVGFLKSLGMISLDS